MDKISKKPWYKQGINFCYHEYNAKKLPQLKDIATENVEKVTKKIEELFEKVRAKEEKNELVKDMF